MRLFKPLNFLIFTLLITSLCLFVSCEDPEQIASGTAFSSLETISNAAAAELVASTNRKSRDEPDDPLAAFQAAGTLEAYSGFDEETNTPFLRVALKENTKRGDKITAAFEVQLDEGIEFPEKIENGRVLYLKNQLIITDLSTNSTMNFFVDSGIGENATPQVPTVNSISLLLMRGKSLNGLDLKATGCSCSCKRCWGGDCGAASASCSCQGDSQEIECRDGYNASCTQCDDGPQQ